MLGAATGCSGTPTGRADGAAPQGPSASQTGTASRSTAVDATTAQQSPNGVPTVAGAAVQQADVERAGITVVTDDRADVPAGTFTISEIQLERMLVEQSLGGGLLDRDLDTIAPMPDSLPPTSFLVQAWLAKGTSDAADTGRAAMGDAARATTGIADIVYPTVVVALFVADLGQMVAEATAEAGATGGSGTTPAGLRGGLPALGESAPCTAANNFVAQTIKGVFDFLKLEVSSGDGIFDVIIGTLANIWNYAVELARGVVQAVVGAITEQIFSKIRMVAAGLGAASILISYLKGQQLVVTVEPQFTRVASGSEPDIPGRYLARAHPLSELWPPALMDCVTAAGGKMPELMLPGASARWRLIDPPARAGLVVPATLTTTVAADHRAYLDFVTGREPAEWAGGPESADGPIVTVEVEQKGITDFLRETKDSLLGGLKASIVGLIPIAQVRAALTSVIGAVLDPIAARIEAELNSTVGGMFTLKGHAEPIMVTYHGKPDDPAPGPEPPASKPSDPFCDAIRDLAAWGIANQSLDVEPYAAEVLGRMISLRAIAPPPMRGPVDAGIPVYQAAAAGGGMGVVMLGIERIKAWGNAAQQIIGYCKIRPEEWPQLPDE